MSNETQNAVSRNITIYATKGAKKAKIETAVTTWKELKSIVSAQGYDLDKLHATENINKSDLVNEAAVLPVGDFTLFLRPKQTKSGNRGVGLSYKEIKATIKADMEVNEEAAKAHYNQDKNYTVKGTEELRNLVNSYVVPTSEKKSVVKEQKAEVVEVIEEKAEIVKVITNADHLNNAEASLKAIFDNASSEDVKDRVTEILEDLFPGLKAEIEGDSTASTSNVADVVASVAESKESPEEEGKRLAREKAQAEEEERIAQEKAEKEAAAKAEKEEDDRLAAEAKELGL